MSDERPAARAIAGAVWNFYENQLEVLELPRELDAAKAAEVWKGAVDATIDEADYEGLEAWLEDRAEIHGEDDQREDAKNPMTWDEFLHIIKKVKGPA